MTRLLILLLYLGGIYQYIAVPAATYLPDGKTFREAAELYYQPYPNAVYGHVTRFGSDELAFDELYRLAQEFKSQYERGYSLLGGGYGYQLIGGMWYLVDNRASKGYTLLANDNATQTAELTDGQRALLLLGSESREVARHLIEFNYTGIISVKSPNDIGRSFCLINLDTNQKVGYVIAGGVAARNDWLYYGPSVNDTYGHLRIGQRISKYKGVEYPWLADLSNSVWGSGMQYAALLDPEMCE